MNENHLITTQHPNGWKASHYTHGTLVQRWLEVAMVKLCYLLPCIIAICNVLISRWHSKIQKAQLVNDSQACQIKISPAFHLTMLTARNGFKFVMI